MFGELSSARHSWRGAEACSCTTIAAAASWGLWPVTDRWLRRLSSGADGWRGAMHRRSWSLV